MVLTLLVYDMTMLLGLDLPLFRPGGPKKDIRFMAGENGCSEALSFPEARRGAELHKRD